MYCSWPIVFQRANMQSMKGRLMSQGLTGIFTDFVKNR